VEETVEEEKVRGWWEEKGETMVVDMVVVMVQAVGG